MAIANLLTYNLLPVARVLERRKHVQNDRFRLSASTFGVRIEGSKLAWTVLIPRNSVIKIVSGVENPRKMIEVDSHGLRLLVFAQDVRDRGQLIDGFYKSLKRCCDFEPEKSFRYGRAHRSRGHNL